MNLYYLSFAVLIFSVLLAILVFVSYRKRLASASQLPELSYEIMQLTFSSTTLEKYLGYALFLSIAYLVWQTIKQGFDFSLLIVGFTFFSGVIWFLDKYLIKSSRQPIIVKARNELQDFDAKMSKNALEPGLIENCRAFFPILVFVLVFRSFLIEPFQIPSGSMRPTLEVKDFIFVNRFIYGLRMPVTNNVIVPIKTPKRGEVIVFKPPHDPNRNFIKRVVAVPGDLIQYDYNKKQMFVNGQLIEKRLKGKVTDDEGGVYLEYTENLFGYEHQIYQNLSRVVQPMEWLPKEGVVLPEGKYFVMGDNRDNSFDARYWEGQRRQLKANEVPYSWAYVDESDILGKAFYIWMHWETFFPSFSRTGSID